MPAKLANTQATSHLIRSSKDGQDTKAKQALKGYESKQLKGRPLLELPPVKASDKEVCIHTASKCIHLPLLVDLTSRLPVFRLAQPSTAVFPYKRPQQRRAPHNPWGHRCSYSLLVEWLQENPTFQAFWGFCLSLCTSLRCCETQLWCWDSRSRSRSTLNQYCWTHTSATRQSQLFILRQLDAHAILNAEDVPKVPATCPKIIGPPR